MKRCFALLLGLLFDPEDAGSMFLRSIDTFLADYMASSQKVAFLCRANLNGYRLAPNSPLCTELQLPLCREVHKVTYNLLYKTFADLSVYGSKALVDLGRFFSFLIYTQSVELLGRGISPSQGRYLHTQQQKHRINAHRHPCLVWDSNPRSQGSSGRRRFMP
jgi:hypothetical protein